MKSTEMYKVGDTVEFILGAAGKKTGVITRAVNRFGSPYYTILIHKGRITRPHKSLRKL